MANSKLTISSIANEAMMRIEQGKEYILRFRDLGCAFHIRDGAVEKGSDYDIEVWSSLLNGEEANRPVFHADRNDPVAFKKAVENAARALIKRAKFESKFEAGWDERPEEFNW